jgi:23S rRNA (adenine2503-C2)-methyltransferase
MKSSLTDLYDLSRAELGALVAGWGFSDYHAGVIWRYLYRDQALAFEAMVALRPELVARLQVECRIGALPVLVETSSSDGYTRKFLLGLDDGQSVETVLMRFHGRNTACLSTQAGCAMGCVFCATGQMGFARHLSAGEIVAQALHVTRLLAERGDRLRNIVLMGMGEPLHNYEATMAAVDTLMDAKGLAFGPRFITLSTVGIAPAIRRLADEERPIHLAVSLHAATDGERSALLPVNRRWNLEELIAACRYYSEKRQRRVFFEWALIAGVNDTDEQARALGRLLQGLKAHVNLIPLNPTEGYGGAPSQNERVRAFQRALAGYGLPSTVRQRRGLDVNAGCGQLRATVARPKPVGEPG